jgi:putative membrane protein
MRKAMLAGMVGLSLAALPALAGQQPTTAQKADKVMAGGKMPDETFVQKAAMGGMAEVELGRIATEKAGSDEVKKFGQRMVDDHGKASEELKTLAQNKRITLATTLDPHHKAMQDRLAKLSGPAFDRAYMQAMLVDHKKDLNEFRMEAKSGQDPDVKGWAAKTLPTLEEHLKLAQNANHAVGTSGTAATHSKAGKQKGSKAGRQ